MVIMMQVFEEKLVKMPMMMMDGGEEGNGYGGSFSDDDE